MGEIAFLTFYQPLICLVVYRLFFTSFCCILLYFVVFRLEYLERIAETASGINSLPIQEDPLIFKSLTVGICFVANNATCNFGGMKS